MKELVPGSVTKPERAGVCPHTVLWVQSSLRGCFPEIPPHALICASLGECPACLTLSQLFSVLEQSCSGVRSLEMPSPKSEELLAFRMMVDNV